MGKATQDQQVRVGSAMRELGWEKTKRRFGEPKVENCYVKGNDLERQIRISVERTFDTRGNMTGFRVMGDAA